MLKSESNQYQYLFLGGILGEVLALPFVGNYLRENKKILVEMGVKAEDITCTTLNSMKPAHENAVTLSNLINELYKKSGKQIIIFGHSKACLEMILCMKDHLSLFRTSVRRLVCVQPPFQGSSLFDDFDFLHGVGVFWPGLNSLKKHYYSEIYENELVYNPKMQAYMKEHLLVVRSHKTEIKNVSWVIKPSFYMMKRKGHSSDGLVKLVDQMIPKAAYREIVLDIDHSDLFTSVLLSNRNAEFRANLMEDIINWAISEKTCPDIDPQFYHQENEFSDTILGSQIVTIPAYTERHQ